MTKTFRELGVDRALCDALEAQGIVYPFPIQELTLPLALDGNDLIGQARTGTGKTLAFGLPLLQQLDASSDKTQALVVVPTRELCVQVHSDLAIGETLGLTTVSVYGGTPYEAQIEALTSGVHVVVGTPGRLIDHLNRGNLDLSHVKVLVLDEADEMLDMGFLPDVERLIEATPSEGRHTMLFSATMPTAIVKMARRYLSHPTFTRADAEEHETAPNVTQHFFSVHRMDKPRLLARILQSADRGGVYVFVRTKHMADRLVNELEDLGVPAIPIHGDLRQTAREKNLDRFREGKATVLVATEVAARGLDVLGVTHVVNYDCPEDQKMYLHRIGRTARAGEAGVAITFAEFNETDRLNVIRKAVGATDAEILPVFSTSKVLTELFDLPEDKPWDHLAGTKRTGDGGRGAPERERGRRDDRARRSDRGSDDRRSRDGRGPAAASEPTGEDRDDEATRARGRGSSGRKGRSDGRPKSSRRSEGSRSDRDATRDRPRDRAPSGPSTATSEGRPATGDDEPGTGERNGRAARGTPAEGGDDASRTRTRTRTRARAASRQRSSEDRDPGHEAGSGSGTSRAEEPATTGTGSDSGQRTRARAGRTRAASGEDQAEDRARERAGGSRNRSERSSGGRGGDDRDRDRGGRTADDGGDGGRSSGGRSGGGRSSGGRTGGGRSGGGRTGGGRDGDERSGRERAESTPMRTEPRGRSARGEGEPQLARRVKVEHLP